MANEITEIAPAAIAESIASAPSVFAEAVTPAAATSDVVEVIAAEPKRKPGRPRKSAFAAAEMIKVSPGKAAKARTNEVRPVVAAKPAVRKPAKVTKAASAKVTAIVIKPRKSLTAFPRSAAPKAKDIFIMTANTTEMTATIQTAMKDATVKAKAAFEKSQTAMGEMGTFTKGNVEAAVESGKILAAGLQEMGKSYVAETKSVVETMTAEIKDLASVKSPAEFFEKQSAMLRKQFDAAVAASSKNSEAMLKLASEAFQPISNRVSLAVEKIKQAA